MSADEVIRPELAPQPNSIEVQLGSDHQSDGEPSIDSVETSTDTGYFGEISSEHVNHSTAASSSSSPTQKVVSEHTNHAKMISHDHHHHHHDSHHHNHHHHGDQSRGPASSKPGSDPTHHHHVPQNAFLSIGLQTSLAIALHKLPEGFITYATNHASPTLGLTVFLALFIHNIVEGYAMALPLYLALNSRWKAMFWSSLLGGISQPAGAGIAALWIWGSGHTGHDSTGPSWGVYGGMFAMTAGVMTSVALQLFSEGLGLTHHRGMGIGFAVAGMGLMGFSFALTA
jgi:ZIP family zinc transporter